VVLGELMAGFKRGKKIVNVIVDFFDSV